MTQSRPITKRTCQSCGVVFRAKYANYCPDCRPLVRRKKRAKYRITEDVKRLLTERYDSRVAGRAAEIGAELGWPAWAVKQKARRLGLSRPWPKDRRPWTDAEVEFLVNWTGLRSSGWIAQRLKRGETSVILKQKRLGLSRRVRDGYYSMRDVARCFGLDDHVIQRWIGKGWLSAEHRGTDRPNDTYRISSEALLGFARNRRQEYRLDKVDQAWFLALVFGDEDLAPIVVEHRRPCSRCGELYMPPGPSSKICPRCRIRPPGRRPPPTPGQIAERATKIRRDNGHAEIEDGGVN